MNRRRITFTIGAAAVGLLAAAFLPAAIAFADDQYTLIPEDVETVTSMSGMPPLYQETLGTNVFGVGDVPFTGTVERFNGEVDTFTTSWGFENQEIIVTGGQLGGHLVPTGSLFDYTNFGGGFGNEYSDIEGYVGTFEGPNTITDTFITPFGDFNIPTTFDAIALLESPGAIIP
ncbi:MAG TPA: hypothetical protein VN741_18230 [Mycobacterium sp.]|nr:hypothetical protein [Mycobacterium sp.]